MDLNEAQRTALVLIRDKGDKWVSGRGSGSTLQALVRRGLLEYEEPTYGRVTGGNARYRLTNAGRTVREPLRLEWEARRPRSRGPAIA
jgi:hypothetical protein